MSSPVRSVDEDMSVTTAARILARNRIGSLVVTDDGVKGIVTETDVVETVAADYDTDRMTVGQLMTDDVITVDVETPVESACETMRANEIKKLPVTEDGELAGVVTTTDIAHSLVPGLDEIIVSFQ